MVAPAEAARERRAPRLHNDPDRYIRSVKGGRYQARPYDDVSGERDDLGTFATRSQARKAIEEYWWGLRVGKPRFVRAHHGRAGLRYFVVVPAAADAPRAWERVGGWFDTPEAAARARDAHLVRVHGPARAAELLSRRDTSRRGRFLYRHAAG